MRTQIRILQPAMFVPFASFIYFSHAENFFMNRAVNRIPDVYEFATHELQVPTVVLYPGDHWEVDAPRDSSESIRRYEVDLSRALAAPPETSPSIPITRLQLAADAFIRKCTHKNKPVLLNALMPSVIHLRDLGIDVEFSYRHGLAEVNGKQADIIMSCDSLLYCLINDWGGEWLAINGRYEVPAGRNAQWFFWIFRVPAHNRIGNPADFGFLARQVVQQSRRVIVNYASRNRA